MKIKKVWNMSYRFSIRYPITTMKDNVKAVKNNIKSFIMRGKYGVSTMDCWDLDNYMLTSFRNGLIMFKKDNNGYPGKGDADTPEKWDAILDRMIEICDDLLIEPIEDPKAEEIYQKACDGRDVADHNVLDILGWNEAIDEATKRKEEEKKELGKLLVKWYDSLWW